MKIKNKKKNERKQVLPKKEPICPNCGKEGLHFIPPSLGEAGFFACKLSNLQDSQLPRFENRGL